MTHNHWLISIKDGKSNSNKIIRATFTKRDEPLISISNIDQCWNDNKWGLELHYTNLKP